MLNLKKVSVSLATVALTVTAVTLSTTTAQAAIVGGQTSGTWQYDFDGDGGFNVGDLFTADYTYDSANITTYDYSDSYWSRYLIRTVSLLSLVLNSGAVSHTFDFDNGGGTLQWDDIQVNPAYGQDDYKGIYLSASDYLEPIYTSFYASKNAGQDYNGSPFSNSFAQAYSYDYSTGAYPTGAYTYGNVTFSDPSLTTSVPTPALLPGLIGLGVSALRRRKQLDAVAVSEQG